MSMHCTEEEARALVNIITLVPHRTLAQAVAAISPYTSLRQLDRSQSLSRVVTRPIPSINRTQVLRREQIEEDYHRLKLLDTLANLCRELENYECEGDGVGVETATLRP